MLNSAIFIALGLTIYTYLVFPAILFILDKLIKKDDGNYPEDIGDYPRVAIVCAMYNEEKVVREKIENFLNINYRNLKLYIGSDGSNDSTNSILQEYSYDERIMTFEFPRRGKVYVINDLIEKVDEEIIVFTDANSMFEPNAITNLVKYFCDENIGVVCGRLKLLNNGKETGEGFYWRYETALKKLENNISCVIGANGAIYAVRKVLLQPLPVNTINDDFTISMRILGKGFGGKYAADAIACEEVMDDDSVEFKRHIRDAAGHYRAMVQLYSLLNPFKFKVFFLYFSHRVLRWLVPFFLILLLFLPPFTLDAHMMRVLYLLELIFYLFVAVGWLSKTKAKIFYVPYYFIYINIALLIGFFKQILGVQKVTWDSTAR